MVVFDHCLFPVLHISSDSISSHSARGALHSQAVRTCQDLSETSLEPGGVLVTGREAKRCSGVISPFPNSFSLGRPQVDDEKEPDDPIWPERR